MKQPKALSLLSVIQMGKFFSHYGMRTLLVLFMVKKLSYSDGRAFCVSALFCGLVELGGIFGGLLADRFLGIRRAMFIGSLVLMVGYGSLIFEGGLYVALGLIILGASLFAGNLTAMLGEAYEKEDPRRERGFTVLYMLQNLGALLSSLLCAFVAELYGFRAGFAVAGVGMVIANLLYFVSGKRIAHIGGAPKKKEKAFLPFLGVIGVALAIAFEKWTLPILPWVTLGCFIYFGVQLYRAPELPKRQVRQLFVFLGALILFFAIEDQMCSSLLVFAEKETTRQFLGFTIPSAVVVALNPIVILIFGALFVRRVALVIPFALLTGTFALLAVHASFGLVLGGVMMISIAELMVGPIVYSAASKVAAYGRSGTVMGMLPIAFSLAFLSSGGLGKMVASDTSYGAGFAKIAVIVAAGGIILEFLMRKFRDEKAKTAVYER